MQYNNKTSNSSLKIEMTKGLHALHEVEVHIVMKVICLSTFETWPNSQ